MYYYLSIIECYNNAYEQNEQTLLLLNFQNIVNHLIRYRLIPTYLTILRVSTDMF